MGTVIPESESLRRAVKWISEQLQGTEHKDPRKLLQDAALRFNLSPKDTQFIYQFYKDYGK